MKTSNSIAEARENPEDLQALVVGVLVGSLINTGGVLDIRVEMISDDDGDLQPAFLVTGNRSGTRLRVHVEII